MERVTREDDRRRCFVTEYHPSLPPMSSVLRKHWSVMTDRDGRLKRVFPKPSMVAYKRGKSLRELLCRARMPDVTVRRSKRQMERHGFSNCGQFLCVLCPFAETAKTHVVSGKTYRINGLINCGSTGCVYKILCQKCYDFVYFGETGRTLRTRFGEHKGDIENARSKPVSEHFNQPGHTLADVIFIGIEKVVRTG